MTGSITDYGAGILLDYIFNQVPHPAVTPCWGVAIATPSNNSFTEISGAGYSRVLTDATYFSFPANGLTSQIKDINFPKSEGYTGEIYGVGLFENITASQPLVYWTVSDVETVKLHGGYTILSNGINFQFASNSTLSQWLKHAIINYFFRGVGMSLGGTQFTMRYCTTIPDSLAFGTEPSGGGYVEQTIDRTGTNFSVANREAELRNDIQFPYATADQGNVSHIGYFSGSQYLFWGVGDVLNITTNSAFTIGAGTTITIN